MNAKIEIADGTNGKTIQIIGDLTEELDFDTLKAHLSEAKVIDLEKVSSLTSMGIAMWCRFFENYHNDHPNQERKVLTKCSFSVIYQLCYIPEFSEHLDIDSFMVPFYCENCGAEDNLLKSVDEVKEMEDPYSMTEGPCKECSHQELILSGYCSDYFSFLEEMEEGIV